jgi:hypothetical protein
MTLLVRNEEDIIEWNLRYHLAQGVDHFVVTDNLSSDGTADILRRYERAGVVTYLFEPADDYSQDRWVTRMAVLAQTRLRPHWLLHCDADEFWWPGNTGNLKDAFARIPADVRAVQADRHNFVGPPEHGNEPFYARMVYRQRTSMNYTGQPLPPKIAHRPLRDPAVHQGNHAVFEQGDRVPPGTLDDVTILHFPARTPDQLHRKVSHGGAAYARNTRFDHSVGVTWRAMYEDLRADRFGRVIERNFLTGPAIDDGGDFIEDHRLHAFLRGLSA